MARPKLKGLGRGLDALLGNADDDDDDRGELQTLAIDALRPGKYQPRTRMDPGSLDELAASIRSRGIMQPIMVRPLDGGDYEIIAGERRWRAAQMAGLADVPVVIRDVDDQAAMAMALPERTASMTAPTSRTTSPDGVVAASWAKASHELKNTSANALHTRIRRITSSLVGWV